METSQGETERLWATVRFHPCYLPGALTHIILVVVPSAAAWTSCDIKESVVARLQTQRPNPIMAISGDFNHATALTRLSPTLQIWCGTTVPAEKFMQMKMPPLSHSSGFTNVRKHVQFLVIFRSVCVDYKDYILFSIFTNCSSGVFFPPISLLKGAACQKAKS